MKFGDYIRQKREEHGLTQPEAAARADIEQSYLSKLETGKSYPSEDIFNRLMSAYGIKVEDLCRSVFSGEMDKLREIKEVRAVVLSRQRSEAHLMRGWLLAGLVMLMIGGGMLGLAFSIPDHSIIFKYRSEGVIKNNEPPLTFKFLLAGKPDDEGKTYAERIDFDFKTLHENRGDFYIEKVPNGYRRYSLVDQRRQQSPTPISWHYALGGMFLIGGLACFYIARRWR
ncbi:MAG: helix-turn-helix transcriptional regulator [Alphaproteobacteria bacterium]|nr:helix-turn-helix transcriptional regulator [Alphaproteobacteria bacterium]